MAQRDGGSGVPKTGAQPAQAANLLFELYTFTLDRLLTPLQLRGEPAAAPGGSGAWPAAAYPAAQSGCDSSDCSYCQGLARMRRVANCKPGCWLRRKRSRTDLASLGAAGAAEAAAAADGGSGAERADGRGPPSGEAGCQPKQPRVMSIWDHALSEPWLADRFLEREGGASSSGAVASSSGAAASSSKAYRAWQWEAAGGEAPPPQPPPARLHQVAAFQRPEPRELRRQTADIVCAVEFEEHGWLVATAGVAKQVRVYSLSSYLESPGQQHWQLPIRVHRMPSKLSSLAWNPDQPGVVTVGDYDGELTQLDLETGHMVAEADGHAGRRVWSVSHSRLRPHLCASASDDGTVRLWGGPCLAQAAGVLRPPSGAPACSVQLSPFDEHTLAVASSDHNVYVYDLRRPDHALWVLSGHDRAASYVRFLSRSRIVSASVDSSLAAWDLPGVVHDAAGAAAAGGDGETPADLCRCNPGGPCLHDDPEPLAAGLGAPVVRPWRHFRGHRNCKNFVGLSVRPEGGLLACGSEGPEAFAYQLAWEAPLARCALAAAGTAAEDTAAGAERAPGTRAAGGGGSVLSPFVSAVCWQPAAAGAPGGTPLLAAAMSDGELRVLGLQAPCV